MNNALNTLLALGLVAVAGTACVNQKSATSESSGSKPAATATTKTEESGKTAKKKPRVICRMEKPIGSHIAKRRCYTQEQIKAAKEAGQDAAFELQRRVGGTTGN